MDIRKYARIFLNIAVPLMTIYLICVWGPRLLGFFIPFVIGWVVAMIANPLVRFLEKKIRIVRRHSSMVLIVGVLALVIFGLYFLGSRGLKEMVLFVRALPGLYAEVQEDVAEAYAELEQVLTFLPPEVKDSFGQVIEQLGAYIGGFLQDLAASAGGAVARTLPDVLVHTIVVLLSSYLFLAEHDVIVQRIKEVMPGAVKRYAGLIKKDVRKVIGGYFMAQFKIMFVVALVLMGGLMLLGVHYWAVLAVAIAILDFLPMFGTGTVLIPWAAASRSRPSRRERPSRLCGRPGTALRPVPGGPADHPAQDRGGQHGASASDHPVFPVPGIQAPGTGRYDPGRSGGTDLY